jgi:hypothetical protein
MSETLFLGKMVEITSNASAEYFILLRKAYQLLLFVECPTTCLTNSAEREKQLSIANFNQNFKIEKTFGPLFSSEQTASFKV